MNATPRRSAREEPLEAIGRDEAGSKDRSGALEGGRRAACELAEFADQVRLVRVAAVQSHVHPVRFRVGAAPERAEDALEAHDPREEPRGQARFGKEAALELADAPAAFARESGDRDAAGAEHASDRRGDGTRAASGALEAAVEAHQEKARGDLHALGIRGGVSDLLGEGGAGEAERVLDPGLRRGEPVHSERKERRGTAGAKANAECSRWGCGLEEKRSAQGTDQERGG